MVHVRVACDNRVQVLKVHLRHVQVWESVTSSPRGVDSAVHQYVAFLGLNKHGGTSDLPEPAEPLDADPLVTDVLLQLNLLTDIVEELLPELDALGHDFPGPVHDL